MLACYADSIGRCSDFCKEGAANPSVYITRYSFFSCMYPSLPTQGFRKQDIGYDLSFSAAASLVALWVASLDLNIIHSRRRQWPKASLGLGGLRNREEQEVASMLLKQLQPSIVLVHQAGICRLKRCFCICENKVFWCPIMPLNPGRAHQMAGLSESGSVSVLYSQLGLLAHISRVVHLTPFAR